MDTATLIEFFNADLMQLAVQLKEQNEELTATNLSLTAELEKMKQEKEGIENDRFYYREKYELLRRQLFGPSSERRKVEAPSPAEPMLPGFEDTNRPKPPPSTTETISYTRRKPAPEGTRGPRNSRFPKWLRRVQEILEPISCECSKCKGSLKGTGNFEITEKLCCSRDPFYVKEFHRELMVCPECDIPQPRPPVPEVFERSLFDHTTVAYLLVQKFCLGLPFYRQAKIFKDLEIKVSSDSITRIALQSLELLEPIYKAISNSVLGSAILVADDTRLLAATGKNLTKLPQYKRGCLWGFFGDANEVMYQFSPARTHQSCFDALGAFSGQYLVCDGYEGFDAFVKLHPNVILVNCNNHARRKFIDAEIADKERAAEAATFYQHLYRIEEEATQQGLSPEERKAYRIQHAEPLLHDFKKWNQAILNDSNHKDLLHKAASYVLSRWDSLTAYLKDGRLPLDSMQIERAFRSIAVGRKNWLHASSELGAQLAAVGYTIVNSCILANVDPFIYFADVLERISEVKHSNKDVLLPRVWRELYYQEARKKYLEIALE